MKGIDNMIALETKSTIAMVNKIENYKLHDEYVIRFNNDTVYKTFENKEDAEITFEDLKTMLKSSKLNILKG